MTAAGTFYSVINKYRKISFSEKDKGESFQCLIKAFLLTDPKFASLFQKVWLWMEFPGRKSFGGSDTGIDLVALTTGGDYWAIQCKCYQDSSIINKPEVDSFLSTSSRTFKGEDAKTHSFAHRLWISTTNKWGPNAQEAIRNQNPAVSRVNLFDLAEAPVNWRKLDKGIIGKAAQIEKKQLRPHQMLALEKVHEHFKINSRGKLIMACGTGKTFNSLRIAENETGGKGLILFLVPSIALLGQTLNEWYADALEPIQAICICSDPEVSKNRKIPEDIDTSSVVDLALPASTKVDDIIHQFKSLETNPGRGMTVVFSTYHSIDVISKAQKQLRKINLRYAQFDLIICDEAHRTTGVSLAEDESAFTKVHNENFLKAAKRLYMTATPRLYDDNTKSRAAEADAILCSMDDEALYGGEIFRIGFGEAVEKALLADYKVLILTLNENDVPPAVQKMIADKESEINTEDASKLIGCINALSKQILGDEGIIKESDPEPMRRAVAFCQNIAASKKIARNFNFASTTYISALPSERQSSMQVVASKHIDGTMNATGRDDLLSWLKSDPSNGECRVLTNVRCLSEGVDMPSLDAVLFLSARNSQVDVVQSVGRVMRKAPGKRFGYIIIPIIVPAKMEVSKALDDNERFKAVWTVLNALRAHDDRFNATVNKIELNKRRPGQILVLRPGISFDEKGNPISLPDIDNSAAAKNILAQMSRPFDQLQSAVFSRMVLKAGEKRYWEQWAKSVAEIAQRQITRIEKLIKEDDKHQKAFDEFLKGLHKNINPGVTQLEAIEMLSQHIITRPVFDALFEGSSFVQTNPVSRSLQKIIGLLEKQSPEKDTETLQKFYDSVRTRVSGIDNAEGRQRIIIELYDKFFKNAFPKMAERLGIVYTPVEIVDFMIHSVADILEKDFGRNIAEENIHILDPFTGTGTFITRLLQSGLIGEKDLRRKYASEIHANEIVLLAYYIAAVNIENACHDILGEGAAYSSFKGIRLTDTFQLGETEDGEKTLAAMFSPDSKSLPRHQKLPLHIIIGNPPYSKGQKSANDNAQNQSYPKLDARISQTYVKDANKGEKMMALYDSYIKAFRWSADRLDKNGGIICFVSNSSWLDSNSTNGFRKSVEKEFSSIYVFNLRGNARTGGELRQKEGGGVFGLGSRTPISISLLVKNPALKKEKADIYYHDIGDYLSKEEKLERISRYKSFANPQFALQSIQPNEHGDWISMRNDSFDTFIPLEAEKKYDAKSQSFFLCVSGAIVSSRDAWVFNFSQKELQKNIRTTINHYNEQRERVASGDQKEPGYDSKKGNWSEVLLTKLKANVVISEENEYRVAQYRPFVKANTYFSALLNHSRYQLPRFFPANEDNLVICVTGKSLFSFSVLMSNKVTEFGFLNGRNGTTQCFPLYFYEEKTVAQNGLLQGHDGKPWQRRDAISDFILERARSQYGKNVEKEDVFYYVYGFLHSREYRETFANDLKKMLPRLPLVEDVKEFWSFSKAGRLLADLHLNYEGVAPYPGVDITGDDGKSYTVEKMRFPKKDQKDSIIYNSRITISNIPARAYEYVVNGKSAIEWIMERYRVTTHKESGITNNPNDWASEADQPRYILDLLLRIIHVSVQTMDIVEGLPKVKF